MTTRLRAAAIKARRRLEAVMDLRNYTYQSDFAKKHFAQGVREGFEQGYRGLLRMLLEQRFGALPADIGAKLDEADVDSMKIWVGRVLTAGSLADVFAADPAP